VSRRATGDQGVTLIELLIATVVSVMVMGATLVAVVTGFNSTAATSTKLNESHDAQLVETYLPQDLQSATSVLLGPQGTGCATGSGGPGFPGAPNRNLITLQWTATETSGTINYSVSYRIVQTPTEFRLIRFSCSGSALPPGTAPATVVVGHNLLDLNDSRWTATPATTCGSRVSVPIIEASGYTYTVTGNSRTGITSPPTSVCANSSTTTTTAPETTTTVFDEAPLFLRLDMLDTNINGKLDQLVAKYNKNLPAACGTASNPQAASYWSLPTNPIGATVASVAVSGVNATVTLVEGAIDTAATDLRVRFAPAGACAVQTFDNEHPIDLASPVVMSVASVNADLTPGDGLMAGSDRLVFTLSEPIPISTPSSVTVTESQGSSPQPDTINILGITNGAQPIGTGYFTGNNNENRWPATTSWSGPILTIQLAPTCGPCNKMNAGQGTWNFGPAGTLRDADGNALVNPSALPGANFKVF
jgi:hypothetical protein